jgi:GTP-binding protein
MSENTASNTPTTARKLRNIAIIAHVDHGKTTLVDQLLRQSGTFGERAHLVERVMDSNDLEKERGITILAKNTALRWTDPETNETYLINIVDTPGHADFGGEVERILSMVDSVLLLVDAVDGPMPQTRFVTQKAFAQNLKPIVVVNKIDRDGARPDWVVNQIFDLFSNLGATDEQLDFPIVYASAIMGYAKLSLNEPSVNMDPLFRTIIERVEAPKVNENGPFQMQISSLSYSSYVGAIGIGRITRGKVKTNSPIMIVKADGTKKQGRILQILGHLGLEKVEVPEASAGDIICVTGVDTPNISDTLCDLNFPEALPPLQVDEPTVSMTFQVNNSPFAGREGKLVTSRRIMDRLQQELIHNVALRVKPLDDPDKFQVSGRGELHLGILIETMRREGFELAVSRPEVIMRENEAGELEEPYEHLIVDVEEQYQGAAIERLGMRQAEMKDMSNDGKGRARMEFMIPSRGLIGFHTEFLTATCGTGIMHHVFDHYGPKKQAIQNERTRGALISSCTGKALAYGLFNLQERGSLFVGHGTEVYEGMVIGLHSRDNDLVVNPTKAKQLTNIRAAGSDENIVLTPPIRHSLEEALEFINDDELVEVTPKSIRIRKKHLLETDRKRVSRSN